MNIKEAVIYLQNYIDTYDQQEGYEDYSESIFIDDILYGLGVSIDKDKYSYADGYRKFLEENLLPHIQKQLNFKEPSSLEELQKQYQRKIYRNTVYQCPKCNKSGN